MTEYDLFILDRFLRSRVAQNKMCAKCEFKHTVEDTCFCYFAFECLQDKNKYNYFMERKGIE